MPLGPKAQNPNSEKDESVLEPKCLPREAGGTSRGIFRGMEVSDI